MYFGTAFNTVHLGTQDSSVSTNVNLVDGFLITAGFPTIKLTEKSSTANSNYGPGSYGFFDPKNGYKSVVAAGISGCCPLILASATPYTNDQISPMIGGYHETNKSKLIIPNRIERFFRVDPCTPTPAVVHIGSTPFSDSEVVALAITNDGAGYPTDGTFLEVDLLYTSGSGGAGAQATVVIVGGEIDSVTITNPGGGYTTGNTLHPDVTQVGTPTGGGATAAILTVTAGGGTGCCPEFVCGETYYLKVEVKGSPALRFANHQLYRTLPAYTGCCDPDAPAPTQVDSTLVMIAWANEIIGDPYLQQMIQPVVVGEDGTIYYAPGTANATDTWDNYVSPGHTADACAGLILYGAYVETKFGNCSFQVSDFYEREPVKIYASEVDLNGDPCSFTGICVVDECFGIQGEGFGESVLRDLILSERYHQNDFSSDIRIREITQGADLLAAIDRNTLYTKYFIVHSVPRTANPTSISDNDRYVQEIVSLGTNASLETFMSTWLTACGPDCVSLETFTCTTCTPVVDQFPTP